MVVPTLEEGPRIEACLASLAPLRAAGAQVVVSDGGSRDDTVARARRAGAMVLEAPRGRAAQMNAGAAAVGGGLLWFVHADCRPGDAALQAVLALAAEDAPLWGRFDVTLSGPGVAFRIIETGVYPAPSSRFIVARKT